MSHSSSAGGAGLPTAPPPDRRFVRSLFDWLEPRYESAVVAYSLGQDLRWKWELLHRLRPVDGERALDLACGTGLIQRRLVRTLGPNGVVGLDIHLPMLRRARGTLRDSVLVRGDGVRLPFRDGSFDVVTAGYLFKYVPLDPLANEVRRVLRPGGRFGGYDFSAPLTDRAPGWLYGQFLRRVLPWAGRRNPSDRDRWEELFRFLARIADDSGWETAIDPALRRAGFRTVDVVPSLGGAITWAWAAT